MASPAQPCAWNEAILHRFAPFEQNPVSGVAVHKSGAVYDTTYLEVFRLAPLGGIFVESIPHTFSFGSNDGYYPYGGVIVDQSGNVFGTTIGGGQTLNGTVYELQPHGQRGQPWTETILWPFAGDANGSAPVAPVMIGNDGALYGTTLRGGNQGCQIDGGVGCGTAFQVAP